MLRCISISILVNDTFSWKSPSGVSFFDVVDLDKDGKITEEEGFTNPNKAIVKKWVALIGSIPLASIEDGLTRKEFEDYLRKPGPN